MPATSRVYFRFYFTGPLTVHVGSCQLNSRLIKSKFVSEFVGTDKPTKFVSCPFVGSCQLNSRLIKSKFVSTDKPTKFVSCRFVGSYQLNSRLINSGTQREYSSKTLKHSIVRRILVFKR